MKEQGGGERVTARAGADPLADQLRDLAEREALDIVRKRLAAGEDPLAVMESCQKGMLQVGKRYEEGTYYLSALIMAGEILRQVVALLEPALGRQCAEKRAGPVLLGTVAGDIHDIGKNMVAILLRCNGFAVEDLGVDVPPAEFARRAKELKPRAIGLSGLLTVAYEAMRATVAALREDPETASIPVIIGGSFVNEDVARYVGADEGVADVMAGVRAVRRLCGLDEPDPAAPAPSSGPR